MPILNIVCPICTELFVNADDVHSTSCGHLFHLRCLQDWLRRGTNNCPKCRLAYPTSHKIFMSFEESEENSDELKETELKLQSSNEKITQLMIQISDGETMFFQLQEQFTKTEEKRKGLENRIREMNDSENNFMHLQAQYTESSERILDLENQLQQMCIENESKSKELKLKSMETESLKAGLEAGQSNVSDSIYYEKVKILEQKLKHISEEFEKEIATSTQLSIEKMKLQSYINHINSVDNNTTKKAKPRQNDKKSNSIKNRENRGENSIKKPVQRSTCHNVNNDTHSIIIKDLPLDLITLPLETVVINLASKMNLTITTDDLIKVNLLTNKDENFSKAQMFAQFKSSELKAKFISTKNSLRNDAATKSIMMTEYISDEVHSLLKYAQEKLRNNGYNHFFYKNNKVFAKKHRSHPHVILINSKEQVDRLQKTNKISEDDATSPETANKYEENATVPEVVNHDDHFYAIL